MRKRKLFLNVKHTVYKKTKSKKKSTMPKEYISNLFPFQISTYDSKKRQIIQDKILTLRKKLNFEKTYEVIEYLLDKEITELKKQEESDSLFSVLSSINSKNTAKLG